MKTLTSIILISILASSCNFDTFEISEQPIIYSGIDTTYDNQPMEAYCIHTNKLSIISPDSILLYIGSRPQAPIDSPYRIHGNAMIYQGIIKHVTKNDVIKVKWNFDPSEDIFCDNKSTNQILAKKNGLITLIDLTKDTLCIGDIECIKQK